MPKILDNPQKRILDATREEIYREGLEDFKMRDVAKRSGIGVGTIYHYYPDKLALIASVVVEDWMKEVEFIQTKIEISFSFEEAIKHLYDGIQDFRSKEQNIFQQIRSSEFSIYYFKNRSLFLEQVQNIIKQAMDKFHYTCDEETSFLMATCVVESIRSRALSFDTLIHSICKLITIK